jgi:hypothetical protein
MIECGDYRFCAWAFADRDHNRRLVPLTRPLRGRPLPAGERWGASLAAVVSNGTCGATLSPRLSPAGRGRFRHRRNRVRGCCLHNGRRVRSIARRSLPTGANLAASLAAVVSNSTCGATLSPRLSPAGRGRFRQSRNRVRGCCSHDGRSVRSIISSTPSKLSYTSVFDTRTTRKPNASSVRVRSASRATAAFVECVVPSTSTISLPSNVTKSTTYRSIACWRRNFQPPSRRPRSARQSFASALVCEDRSWPALLSNRSIPLTRPLCGRPLPTGKTCTTSGGAR